MSDHTPAKRGDFAVIEKQARGVSLYAGNYCTRKVIVGLVASVTRDGLVKKVEPLNGSSAPLTSRDWDTIQILAPGRLSNPDGFKAECIERQTPARGSYRPFESVADVCETARRHSGKA